jgi:hypothetical protein
MESLPSLSGDRAVSSDPDYSGSEWRGAGMRRWLFPDAASGYSPGTLASFALRNDFSSEGGKTVTAYKILIMYRCAF